MKLYFIRHGQTDWNLQRKIQGSVDNGLNATGLAQAEELGRKCSGPGYSISRIYTSRQKRAVMTSQVLSRALQIPFVPVDGIQEMNLGEWEGLTWEEVEEKFPSEFASWCSNRRYTKAPKGEAYQDVLERSLSAIREIIGTNSGDAAIVTHTAIILCLQCYITNTPFEDMMKFNTENTSITEIDGDAII